MTAPFYSGPPTPHPVYLVAAPGGVVAASGAPATGMASTEYGDGRLHQTVLNVNTVLPAIPGGAALAVGVLLYTFPPGVQIIESAYMSVAITQTQGHINANTPDVGLGSVVASGVVSVLAGTTTFKDILAAGLAANCTGTPVVATAIPTAGVPLISNAAGSKAVYLNVAATWAASGDAAALLTGTVTLNWRTM